MTQAPSEPQGAPAPAKAPPASAPPPAAARPPASAPPPETTRLPIPAPNGDQALAPVSDERDKLPIPDRYIGAGKTPFPANIQDKLKKPVDDKIVEITPDGRVYIPAVHFRRALNDAFGRGGWVLLPWSERILKGTHMYREYALYGKGQYMGEAVGEQEYLESNSRFSYGDAAEGCKSNAIMRCCKELDIYTEIWDPGFRTEWRDRTCVMVPCTKWGESRPKKLWKRKDRGRLMSGQWREVEGPDPDASRGAPRGPARPAAPAPAGAPTAQRPSGAAAPARPSDAPAPAKPTGQAAPARPSGAPAPARPSGQPAPASPPGQPAAQRPASAPAAKAPVQPRKQAAPSGQTRDPQSALHGQIMAGLKRAAGSTKDDVARDLLQKLTGKRKLHDCDADTLKALLMPLHKLGKDEARVEQEGDVTVVIDVVQGIYIWPLGYNPPSADEGSQVPPPEAASEAPPAEAPPAEEAPANENPAPDEGPPPLGDEDVPPGGGRGDFGF